MQMTDEGISRPICPFCRNPIEEGQETATKSPGGPPYHLECHLRGERRYQELEKRWDWRKR